MAPPLSAGRDHPGRGTGSVTINQSSQRAIINWSTFNIGSGETTRFIQPNSSSVALNRVIGGLGPTQISGTLTANGQVFLINRDGVLFGPNSVINTAGFLATTNDIKNSDFMAGKYNFNIPGRPDASIVNQGTHHRDRGRLRGAGGARRAQLRHHHGDARHRGLAAGNSFTLDFYGDRLITLAVSDQIAAKVKDVADRPNAQVAGHQRRQAQRQRRPGRAHRGGGARGGRFRHQQHRRDQANSIGTKNGMIVLGAATGASKPAGAADADRKDLRQDVGRRQGQGHERRHRRW